APTGHCSTDAVGLTGTRNFQFQVRETAVAPWARDIIAFPIRMNPYSSLVLPHDRYATCAVQHPETQAHRAAPAREDPGRFIWDHGAADGPDLSYHVPVLDPAPGGTAGRHVCLRGRLRAVHARHLRGDGLRLRRTLGVALQPRCELGRRH